MCSIGNGRRARQSTELRPRLGAVAIGGVHPILVVLRDHAVTEGLEDLEVLVLLRPVDGIDRPVPMGLQADRVDAGIRSAPTGQVCQLLQTSTSS